MREGANACARARARVLFCIYWFCMSLNVCAILSLSLDFLFYETVCNITRIERQTYEKRQHREHGSDEKKSFKVSSFFISLFFLVVVAVVGGADLVVVVLSL